MEAGADPALAEKILDDGRQRLLRGAEELQRNKTQFDMEQREYSIAHGFTPIDRPSRAEELHARGKNLTRALDRDGVESEHSASYLTAPKPVYSTPAKYFRAAEVAAAELPRLTGDMLLRQ